MSAIFDHRVRHDLDEAFNWLEEQPAGLSLEGQTKNIPSGK